DLPGGRVPNMDVVVGAGGGEKLAARMPGHRLDTLRLGQGLDYVSSLYVPNLHDIGVFAGDGEFAVVGMESDAERFIGLGQSFQRFAGDQVINCYWPAVQGGDGQGPAIRAEI